jgi:thymidylate synthase (FAD)
MNAETQIGLLEDQIKQSFATYKTLIAHGWPRELARTVLPLATYTHMFATVSLLNLFKFITLRDDDHAQYEIKVYAKAMKELIRPIVPAALAAFEKV